MKTLVLFLVIGSALTAGETWSDIDYKSGVMAMGIALDAQLTREASYGLGSLSGTIDIEGKSDFHGAVNLV